uniref:Uncharacterized protein n=1 Tax=Myotis myotis TaxID=51298 RepID=A0A7J7XZI0_MYOMY|nr:hypothetical protein mMyoMyo1_011341 [Myotis myotis]
MNRDYFQHRTLLPEDPSLQPGFSGSFERVVSQQKSCKETEGLLFLSERKTTPPGPKHSLTYKKKTIKPPTWVHLPSTKGAVIRARIADWFWGVSTLGEHGNLKEDIFDTKTITRAVLYSIHWVWDIVFKFGPNWFG